MLTRNQIKTLLNNFATNHKQIKTFGYGEEFEQQGLKDCEYPLMWVVPITSNINSYDYARNYRVGIFDRVRKNEENETEVESDTELICLDVLAFFNYASNKNTYSFRFNRESISITPVYAKWSDEVTGNEIDISLVDKFTYDKCAIPMTDVSPVPPIACADATITINTFSFGTAPSGSTFNVVVEDTNGLLVGSKIGSKWIVPSASVCANATYSIVNSLGNVLYSGSIVSGGSLTQAISNSTLNVNNSASTLISSRSILAQGTDSYNVADSVAVIKDSAGTTLKSENILATASENITINDSVAVIKDSAGTTLKSENILAEASENISITDSTAVLKNTAGTTLDTSSIFAQNTKNITLDDFNVEVQDPLGSVILTDSYLAYSMNTLNLTALSNANVVIGSATSITISATAPLTPTLGDIWFQPN